MKSRALRLVLLRSLGLSCGLLAVLSVCSIRCGGGGSSGTGGASGTGTGGAAGGALGTGGGSPATGGAATGGAATGGAATGGAATGGRGTGGGAGGTATGGSAVGGRGTGGSATGGAATGGGPGGGLGGTATGGAAGQATGGAGGGGGSGTGGAPIGGAGGSSAGGACASIKINEVLVATIASADQEFVELYNPCTMPVDLTGYRLVYRPSTALLDTTVVMFAAGTIQAQGFWLVGSYDPNGMRDTAFGINVHFDGPAGGVGLHSPSGTLIDSVAYGVGVTNQLIEGGLAAQAPPAGQSIVRRPDGTDSNRNVVDFSLSLIPSPRTTNQ